MVYPCIIHICVPASLWVPAVLSSRIAIREGSCQAGEGRVIPGLACSLCQACRSETAAGVSCRQISKVLYWLQLNHTVPPLPCITFCLLPSRCKPHKLFLLSAHFQELAWNTNISCFQFSSCRLDCRVNGGPDM